MTQLDIQVYSTQKPIVEKDGTDFNTTIMDVDDMLFWGQFSVPDILDQLEFSDIQEYVQKRLDEDE